VYVSGKSCGWASIFKGACNRKSTSSGVDSLVYIPDATTAEAGPWILRSMSLIIHGCFVLPTRTPYSAAELRALTGRGTSKSTCTALSPGLALTPRANHRFVVKCRW
jgi:hypothetical protein